jgi:hypothetical protein
MILDYEVLIRVNLSGSNLDIASKLLTESHLIALRYVIKLLLHTCRVVILASHVCETYEYC